MFTIKKALAILLLISVAVLMAVKLFYYPISNFFTNHPVTLLNVLVVMIGYFVFFLSAFIVWYLINWALSYITKD